MRSATAAITALILVLLALSPVWTVSQDTDSVYSREGLGAWRIGSEFAGSPLRIQHGPLAQLDPDTDALLVVSPRLTYTPSEAEFLREFLHAGGRAVVADDDGTARSLLARLPVDIEPAGIYSTSFARTSHWPILESPSGDEVILSAPKVVSGAGEVLLRAHPFSWKDLDNDLAPDLNEPNGPWPAAIRTAIGEGSIVVIGDADVFVQTVSHAFAQQQLAWLASNRTVVIDEGHRATTDPIGAVPLLSGAAPLRASFWGGLAIAAAAILALQLHVRRVTPRRGPEPPTGEHVDELPDPS